MDVLFNIQTLRVLFTFMVVTAHLEPIFLVLGVWQFVSPLTYISIDGFILVSAFLIAYTHALRPRSPLGFIGRRMSRLVPFYWFMTIVVSLLALAVPALFMTTVVTPETFLKSMFFIPYEKSPDRVYPIVFVGWTMNLFVFYMAIHALSLKFAGARAWLATAGILTALALAGLLFQPKDVVLAFFTQPRLFSFVAGILLCTWWLHVRHTIVPQPLPAWFKPALLAMGVAALVTVTLRDVLLPGVNPRFIGPVLAGCVVVAAILLERAGAVHRSRLRDTLANASFTIYLTHYFLTQAANKIVLALDITSPAVIVPLLAATYVGVAIVGVAASRMLEEPMEKLVRDGWARMESALRPRPHAH